MVILRNEDIAPKILKCIYFDGRHLEPGSTMLPRNVYDYELEYYTYSDGGGIYKDGIFHPVQKGDVNFRRPGQRVQGIHAYSCYLLVLDIAGNTGKSSINYNFIDQPQQQNYDNPILNIFPFMFSLSSTSFYDILFKSILEEWVGQSAVADLRLKSSLLRLLYQMHLDLCDEENTKMRQTPHFAPIRKAIDFMNANYMHPIHVASVAAAVNLSPSHFHKVFAQTIGTTPNEYILTCKMKEARRLLACSDLTVGEISHLSGFENESYFNYAFKKASGEPPGRYRKRYRYDF